MADWVIKNRAIKVALVGCGRIADNHLKAIAQFNQDLQLVAVCDVNLESMAKVKAQYPAVETYDKIESLVEKSDADIVVLCTPSGMHPWQTIISACSKKHVITEKPMATQWQDGLSMVDTCEKNDVRLFVVKQNRCNATLQKLKAAVDEGRFGRIYMVALNVFWTRPQAYYSQADWRGTWRLDGGAFMNQASHYIDLLHWMFGPVESVQAMTATLARRIEAEDTGVMNVRWRSGALGTLGVTMLTHDKNLEGSITVLGEKGTVRIGGVAVNDIQTWQFEDKLPEDECINDANYETTSVYGFGHPLYYKNVVDVLRGQAEPITTGIDGLKSLELLIAAYRSARDGHAVHLPLNL